MFQYLLQLLTRFKNEKYPMNFSKRYAMNVFYQIQFSKPPNLEHSISIEKNLSNKFEAIFHPFHLFHGGEKLHPHPSGIAHDPAIRAPAVVKFLLAHNARGARPHLRSQTVAKWSARERERERGRQHEGTDRSVEE